jgi:hypothetical protein
MSKLGTSRLITVTERRPPMVYGPGPAATGAHAPTADRSAVAQVATSGTLNKPTGKDARR